MTALEDANWEWDWLTPSDKSVSIALESISPNPIDTEVTPVKN
ncbi:uncharacterized protein METZ01_LOCUS497344 [marine metagenome]|uniref:Uncharacterized protein n=1 Tax=marine metagenome TaxID=408172 RepID=A0A383DJJ5_9ZZZZ